MRDVKCDQSLKLPKDAVDRELRGGRNLGVDRDKAKLSVSIPLTSPYRHTTDSEDNIHRVQTDKSQYLYQHTCYVQGPYWKGMVQFI